MENFDVNKITAPKSVLGAIIGDIVGSIYEFSNIHTKNFELFNKEAYFTDDTVMTLAVYEAIRRYHSYGYYGSVCDYICNLVEKMKNYYHEYNDPKLSYGILFERWLNNESPEPYYSYGNGAAMRLGGVACARSLEEAKYLGVLSASVTHNHPESLDGAECVSTLIYLTDHDSSITKGDLKDLVNSRYYDMHFSLDDLRNEGYPFDESCNGTIPVAIKCFLESYSFEDAIRNAISVGGDSDTIAAITGSIAGPFYGIPEELLNKLPEYLDDHMLNVLMK